MVRDPKPKDEPIECTSDTAASLKTTRARRHSFVFAHTAIANPDLAREIVLRVDEDFERIFGSD